MMNYKTWPEVIVNLPWQAFNVHLSDKIRYSQTIHDNNFGVIKFNKHYDNDIRIRIRIDTDITIELFDVDFVEESKLKTSYLTIRRYTHEFGEISWNLENCVIEYGVCTTYDYVVVSNWSVYDITQFDRFLDNLQDFDAMSVDFITNPIDRISYALLFGDISNVA